MLGGVKGLWKLAAVAAVAFALWWVWDDYQDAKEDRAALMREVVALKEGVSAIRASMNTEKKLSENDLNSIRRMVAQSSRLDEGLKGDLDEIKRISADAIQKCNLPPSIGYAIDSVREQLSGDGDAGGGKTGDARASP